MKKFVCRHPWSHFEVNNPNGDVTMCCNNGTVLGNVNDDSIDEIWNGEKFKSIRKRMRDEGAHAFCPHTCPVLQGGKKYENIDWFNELDHNRDAYKNAVKNEEEYTEKKLELESVPRWLRFTYSYACNLDCYHCYQREDAKMRIKLPDSFMKELPDYVDKAQVIFPFGGEPFFFSPVIDFLENHDSTHEGRFYFITNATILTDRIYDILQRLPITCMAVSLDAATSESFDALRVRGRNADWEQVIKNLDRLKKLKSERGFSFTVSMTLNSLNALEIESFVDLALSYDAEPLISLVSNPYQTVDFQKKFLNFSSQQFDEMSAQIKRCLKKVKIAGHEDSEIYLNQLLAVLRQHQDCDNNMLHFRTKSVARKIYHQLPEQLQIPVYRILNKARAKKLDQYRGD